MPHRYIADLRPGQRIEDDVFLVRSKDLRTTTQGGLYIHAVLQDRTGQLPSRLWQATEPMFSAIPEGGFVRFKGRTENYKGSLQFIIEGMRPAEPGSYEMSDYVAASGRDAAQMWSRFREILEQIEHPDLSPLIKAFLADEALMERFRRAPAASAKHHAYLGGLLEHTLTLLEIALRVIPLYPKLSLDLVLVGLFLHDIAKCTEFSFETSFSYTDQGQLVGHLVQGAIWIEQKAEVVARQTGKPFPETLKAVLQHIVVSHHGQYEFGSPKLPAVPEAVAVHYLDNLDAKINMFLNEIEQDKDPGSHWTNYNTALATKVFKVDPMGIRKNAR
jgi:3'-5' exoribonuclease